MSYATATLASFANMLGTLAHLVRKASEHGNGAMLLEARLAEDMHPLHTQIRFAVGQAVVTLDRLGNLGLTSDDSDISDFADALARIAKTSALVADTDPAAWPAPDATVEFELPNGMAFAMRAHEYVRDWALPQFYFHIMASYAILRAEGLAVGKADYVPYMMKYLKSGAR
jgi:hypothetical protein